MSASRYKSRWSGVSPLGDRIEVIERGPVVQLRVNGVWQGEMDRSRQRILPTPYMQQMLLSLCYAAAMRRFLVIGLGTGRLPKALHAILPKARIDVVEIDPVIVGVAKRYFDLPVHRSSLRSAPGLYVYTQDGVEFVSKVTTTYDAIFVDAFTGGELPEAFRSRKTMWKLSRSLAPGGVLTMNLSRLDVFALQDVVDHMRVFLGPPAIFDPKNDERHDDLNVVLISPTIDHAKRMRERRRFLEEHHDILGLDVGLMLANQLPSSAIAQMAESFLPLFSS